MSPILDSFLNVCLGQVLVYIMGSKCPQNVSKTGNHIVWTSQRPSDWWFRN